MERIILIETSTALCSVALAEDGAVTAYRESSEPKAHASLTAVFVQEVLSERGLKLAECDAVCVSMGPGSYTGLRVGVSTAKGLCFGSGKPLLAVGTLDTLVAQAQMADQVGHDGCTNTVIPEHSTVIPDHSNVIPDLIGDPRFIIPMIDARRMEVYTAVFSSVQASETATTVISSEAEGRVEKSNSILYCSALFSMNLCRSLNLPTHPRPGRRSWYIRPDDQDTPDRPCPLCNSP